MKLSAHPKEWKCGFTSWIRLFHGISEDRRGFNWNLFLICCELDLLDALTLPLVF